MPRRLRRRRTDWYIFTGQYLNFRIAGYLFVVTLLIGTLGFVWVEKYSLLEAVYMTIITISTVGYTEVKPLSDGGRLFVSLYILLTIGVFSYSISAFTYYIVQGQWFKDMYKRNLAHSIEELDGHVILCGYGRYGREAAVHFLAHEIPFVVLEKKVEENGRLEASGQPILFIHGDATQDEVLEHAGILRAHSLITALPDDADNVFVTLTARQMNPKLHIISRAQDVRSEKKLRRAGANHVIMPDAIGGFYMATLVTKPGAVEFFSFIANHYGTDIAFEEIHYQDLPDRLKGKKLEDLHIRKVSGANIIGYKGQDGHFVVNPPPETVLSPGSSFILIGTGAHLEKLQEFMNGTSA